MSTGVVRERTLVLLQLLSKEPNKRGDTIEAGTLPASLPSFVKGLSLLVFKGGVARCRQFRCVCVGWANPGECDLTQRYTTWMQFTRTSKWM